MKGMILIWSGAVVDIPTSWQLCDGTNGTPDLRNQFVVGAGSSYAPDASGGNLTHIHSIAIDAHTHYLPSGSGVAAGTDKNPTTSSTSTYGTTAPTNHLPPYYALCYIMHL